MVAGGQRSTPAVTMGADAGALGVEVPEGAVERVAGGARRHDVLQRLAGQARLDPGAHGLDGRGHALDRLAVAGIGHAFASADGAVRRAIVAVTTTASVREPRAIVKVPAMGKRSMLTVKLAGILEASS